MIPAGGGATHATLVEALKRDGFAIGPAPSFWKDIQALQRESRRALDNIKSHIHGLKLHRAQAYELVREALTDGGRFIQVDGEPGTGKSARRATSWTFAAMTCETSRTQPSSTLSARTRTGRW
jgi:hypothetical protein